MPDSMPTATLTRTEGTRRKTICCYARVREAVVFEVHDFYRIDIRILRDLGYDLIVTNSLSTLLRARCDIYYAWWFGYGIFPALLGFFRRKPVVVSGVLHTLDCQGLSGWPTIKRLIMKLTMKLADCSILCSPGEHDRLDGFRPRNPQIVPLSIDADDYAPAPVIRGKTIVMLTQLNRENVERKMVLQAVAAFAEFSTSHPDFELIIAGAIGDGLESVRECARKFGLEKRIKFPGRISLRDKVSCLQSAWAYLQPTSCEGFGLAIGEALACGTPVVTSPERCVLGTYGDAVQYGTDSSDIARCLTRLADDADFYRAIQSRGLSHIQRYSVANRRSRYKAILDQVHP